MRFGKPSQPASFSRAELNQILYLLQRGMTANPMATWMGSKTPYSLF